MDKSVAELLCVALESKGLRVWMAPRNIRPNRAWGEQITEAIDDAKVVVMIFSGDRLSPQVKRELQRAIENGASVLMASTTSHPATEKLQSLQGPVKWIDISRAPTDDALEPLVATITASLQAPVTFSLPEPKVAAIVAVEAPKRFERFERIREASDSSVSNHSIGDERRAPETRGIWTYVTERLDRPYRLALGVACVAVPVLFVAFFIITSPSAKSRALAEAEPHEPSALAKPLVPIAAPAPVAAARASDTERANVEPIARTPQAEQFAVSEDARFDRASATSDRDADRTLAEPTLVSARAPLSPAECDALAASSDDPDKAAEAVGVELNRINAELAIKACSEAVAAQPRERRLVYQLGRSLMVGKRYSEALETLGKAAEAGSGAAENALGIMSLNGYGTPKNERRAAAFYRQAADKGMTSGMVNLARMHMLGIGVEKDLPKALLYLEVAAKAGSASAKRELAAYYETRSPAKKHSANESAAKPGG
ncbi:toll/interleukin-1 receptor domain-containing protein [Methylosinus sporium]|uniref:toll/interleukin-1 receptor domain-containing protein n=1 Tax=Methylosinus sporium TaxID=428 RepID=UPI00383A9512